MTAREPNQYEVMRNTKTLLAYRARMAGANQASLPFYILPACLNPALYGPMLKHQWPHAPVWAIAAIFLAWLVLAGAAVAFGWRQRRRYLREHPFVFEPET